MLNNTDAHDLKDVIALMFKEYNNLFPFKTAMPGRNLRIFTCLSSNLEGQFKPLAANEEFGITRAVYANARTKLQR